MLGSLWNWLAGLFGAESEAGQSDSRNETDESRFVRSELDQSVMSSHASGREEGERELERLQEQAEQLDQHDH